MSAGAPSARSARESNCPYCEGDGCSECDGTGKRYATHISAGDGLTAIVHGSAPLTGDAADAITEVLRIAYDRMSKPEEGETCGRLLVGRGDDTYDPECVLPRGHKGSCEPEDE